MRAARTLFRQYSAARHQNYIQNTIAGSGRVARNTQPAPVAILSRLRTL
jgi:hypothetical protein